MSELTKQAAETLAQVPGVLRALARENADLRIKVAEFEKRAEAEGLVAEMEERGFVDPQASREEKIAALLNSGKDLGVLKEAMAMSPQDFSPGTLSGGSSEGRIDALTACLME